MLRAHSLTSPKPVQLFTRSMTGIQFIEFNRPIVYIWMRDGKYLYIGLGACGIRRIFANHPHINRDKVKEDDLITWTVYKTVKEAKQAERQLIRIHQPEYNVAKW